MTAQSSRPSAHRYDFVLPDGEWRDGLPQPPFTELLGLTPLNPGLWLVTILDLVDRGEAVPR